MTDRKRAPRISAGHVIWAWDAHIHDWSERGLSVNAIRVKLRDEHSLHVGTEAIHAVLATFSRRFPSRG